MMPDWHLAMTGVEVNTTILLVSGLIYAVLMMAAHWLVESARRWRARRWRHGVRRELVTEQRKRVARKS